MGKLGNLFPRNEFFDFIGNDSMKKDNVKH